MGIETAISWCHHTFNVAWGCTKVSPACTNCYAEAWAKRAGHEVWGPQQPRRTFGEKHWSEPLKWNAAAQKAGERRRVFCSSMADVFEDHPTIAEERLKLWPLIEATPWLDWLLLTKRPENFNSFAPEHWRKGWPTNAWPMTTAENQHFANIRIPELLKVPASVHGVSMEPLLEPVDLRQIPYRNTYVLDSLKGDVRGTITRDIYHIGSNVSWVIVGGESGPNARPPLWKAERPIVGSREFLCLRPLPIHREAYGHRQARGGVR